MSVYLMLKLTDDSRELLAEAYATLPLVRCDHMTIRFGTDDISNITSAFSAARMGDEYQLKVVGFGHREADQLNGAIQAVKVALLVNGQLVDKGISVNQIPHITVSRDDRADSRESNDLQFDEVKNGLVLTAVLDCVSEND